MTDLEALEVSLVDYEVLLDEAEDEHATDKYKDLLRREIVETRTRIEALKNNS